MGPQKPKKPAAPVNEPPEASERVHTHAAAAMPRPTESVKLIGIVVVQGGVLRVVTAELPVDEVETLAARLPAENALERINLEVRNMYMRAIDRRPRG